MGRGGLLEKDACLVFGPRGRAFGGNIVLTVDLLYILRWTPGTSGNLSRLERPTITVRNSLHELLNRSIHFTAQNNNFIRYVLIFNIAPVHGGNKLL